MGARGALRGASGLYNSGIATSKRQRPPRAGAYCAYSVATLIFGGFASLAYPRFRVGCCAKPQERRSEFRAKTAPAEPLYA